MVPPQDDSTARYPGSDWDAVQAAAKGGERTPAFLLVLGRHAHLPSERKLAAFAEALNLDAFTARQWLLSPTPRVIRRESRHDRVLEWTEWMRGLGIRAFDLSEQLLAEQEFHTPPVLFPDGRHWRLYYDDGRQEILAPEDIACAVWGEVQERFQTETTTAAIGGEIIAGRTKTLHAELMLDLHRHLSPISVRIAQDAVRWSAINPDETTQSSLRMRRMLDKFRPWLRDIDIAEDFSRAEPVLGATREILSNSSYLQTKWLGAGGRLRLHREKSIRESSRETFCIYSSLIRWEHLRLGRVK